MTDVLELLVHPLSDLDIFQTVQNMNSQRVDKKKN